MEFISIIYQQNKLTNIVKKLISLVLCCSMAAMLPLSTPKSEVIMSQQNNKILFNSYKNEDVEIVNIIFGWIGGNRYLSYSQMQNNATIVYDYLTKQGWTKNAICAILGNMQLESNINPQIWQNLQEPIAGESSTGKGYGLTQWTPYTKLLSWCSANNLNYYDGYAQLKRIMYERNSTIDRYAMSNFIQWLNYPTAYDEQGRKYCTFTFYDFSLSTKSPSELVIDFMKYYERPSLLGQKESTRIKYANYWWEYFNGNSAAILPPGGLPFWSAWSSRNDSQHRLPIYMLCSRRKAKGEL